MQFKDYYQILGVSRDETADTIKKAFRRLARKYHPDVSKEADAEARIKDINEAYAVLSDPARRAAYDRLAAGFHGDPEFKTPKGWDARFAFSEHGFSPREAADFSDFFTELFGGGMRARGEDLHARVLLDIGDSFTGAHRQISLPLPHEDERGRTVIAQRTLNVRIPKGVREGQVIRLAGQGAPGTGGAPPGDLLLEVRFTPHPQYRLDDRDLYLSLPVAPWEAALGAVIPVRLPDGSHLKIRIPEGTLHGRQLRVRAKGLPASPPGDLLLDIHVVLPPADTPKARQFYETMARELAFDPRR
ncbi:DnaJ C-terminal domain-containing protein [Paludibacterium paludis]|uniref:Curved DNA-binding protein n=1 Tax=Paludibacterium paludis TaxID=1225769 RepID=A0A918UAN0_9NEIS|nr:DnaJ C-terminal domain-containing protein [Paludibacterium paludis]GGY19994.1 curved DNA-binding protein [Paludibacterium paludis]